MSFNTEDELVYFLRSLDGKQLLDLWNTSKSIQATIIKSVPNYRAKIRRYYYDEYFKLKPLIYIRDLDKTDEKIFAHMVESNDTQYMIIFISLMTGYDPWNFEEFFAKFPNLPQNIHNVAKRRLQRLKEVWWRNNNR